MLAFQSAAPFAVQDISPWPDMRLLPAEHTKALAASQTHRRFLKAHMPYDALPVYDAVKFIHVARDGRDAAMSFHNHNHNHKVNMTDGVIEVIDAMNHADPKFAGHPSSFPVSAE